MNKYTREFCSAAQLGRYLAQPGGDDFCCLDAFLEAIGSEMEQLFDRLLDRLLRVRILAPLSRNSPRVRVTVVVKNVLVQFVIILFLRQHVTL